METPEKKEVEKKATDKTESKVETKTESKSNNTTKVKNTNSNLVYVIITILVILVVCAIIGGIAMQQINKNKPSQSVSETTEEEAVPTIDQNIYKVGKQTIKDEDKNKLIYSHEELQTFLSSTYKGNLESIIAMYGEDYFVDRTLSIVYVETPDANSVISVDGLYITDTTLDVGYSFKKADEKYAEHNLLGEAAAGENSNGYIVLVESDKTLTALTSHEITE